MKELIAPHVIGRDATEIEGIWQTLYKSNFWLGRMGVTVFAQSAVDMALWDIVGKRAGLPLFRLWGAARTEDPGLRLGLFPRPRPRRHDRPRQGVHGDGAEGDQDAGRPHPAVARGRAERQGDARGDGRRRRDHDRRQHGLGRRHRDPGRPPHRRVRSLLAGGAGGRRGLHRLPPHRRGAQDPHRRRREPLRRATTCGRSSRRRIRCRSCSPTRCAAATPSCARSPPPPSRGASSSRRISSTSRWSTCSPRSPTRAGSNTWTWNDDLWIEPILPDKTGTMTPPERPGHGLAFRPEILKDHRIGGQTMTG